MGFMMKITYNFILAFGANIVGESRNLMALSTIICVIIGLSLYILLVLIFNIKEAKEIMNIAKNKITKILRN